LKIVDYGLRIIAYLVLFTLRGKAGNSPRNYNTAQISTGEAWAGGMRRRVYRWLRVDLLQPAEGAVSFAFPMSQTYLRVRSEDALRRKTFPGSRARWLYRKGYA
jgi:hypothetical protein